jgi:photosystem II S4 domain protein
MLPHRSLLEGSRDPAALEPLITAAEEALRTWEPVWTGFLAPELCEEAEARLGGLSELSVASLGGLVGAERRRLLLQRVEVAQDPASLSMPLTGLEISGNFLFDPAEAADVRAGLLAAGAEDGEIGDVWLRGERGGQAVVDPALAERLDGSVARVRTVEVRLEARPLEELQPPPVRLARRISTVEASLRLDAVASAGFGVSRSRMAERIREGGVRVNWQPVLSPSRELALGERVQLKGRGELRIEEVNETKRGRWRIVMERT